MTAQELLRDLETCTGPCGRMCLSCPESRYIQEIHDVLSALVDENKRLRERLENSTGGAEYI